MRSVARKSLPLCSHQHRRYENSLATLHYQLPKHLIFKHYWWFSSGHSLLFAHSPFPCSTTVLSTICVGYLSRLKGTRCQPIPAPRNCGHANRPTLTAVSPSRPKRHHKRRESPLFYGDASGHVAASVVFFSRTAASPTLSIPPLFSRAPSCSGLKACWPLRAQ